MESRSPQLPPQPPGAVNALINGFNAVANNVVVILFPVFFDILFWLGPRLKVDALFAPMIRDVAEIQQTMKGFPVTSQMLQEFWGGFNLLSILRTFPLGIFSLMSVNPSGTSPLGLRPNWDLNGALQALCLLSIFTFLGWLGGSFYYFFVSRVALAAEKHPRLSYAIFHSLLLAGIWALAGMVASLPAIFLLGILLLINQTMGVIVYFLMMLFLIWITLPVFFSFHGIFTRAQNALVSIWQSFRVVRYGLPSLGWFAVIVLVISQGLDMLWRIPPADSWMALVGILGHAFISTGLLAASFIFYRDMQTWVEDALQWIKTNQITSARA